jgi:hypothetical protein
VHRAGNTPSAAFLALPQATAISQTDPPPESRLAATYSLPCPRASSSRKASAIYPTSLDTLSLAAATAGAASHRDSQKRTAYAKVEPNGYSLVPFSVVSYGRLGHPAMKLSQLLGDEAAGPGSVSRAVFVAGALRELSIGLIRGNFLLYHASVGMLARSSGSSFRASLSIPTYKIDLCTARYKIPFRMSWRSKNCAARAEHRMPWSVSERCRVAPQPHCTVGKSRGTMARPRRRAVWNSPLFRVPQGVRLVMQCFTLRAKLCTARAMEWAELYGHVPHS